MSYPLSSDNSQNGKANGQFEWRLLGTFHELSKRKCRRVYSKNGTDKDLALFYEDGKFYVMEAWCSHMGGPLFEGQIEDYNGKCHVMCPWHAYMFDLASGENDLGLKQTVFETKVVSSEVFVKYNAEVSILPFL